MGLLDHFDLACLMDREWTDSGGLRRTMDRSKHGIHPLVGDGSTAGTFPTFDASRGLYTFDGSDYLTLRQSDDSADVLANMGSIQDETYCFLFDPYVNNPALVAHHFIAFGPGGAGSLFYVRAGASFDRFELRSRDPSANVESLNAAGQCTENDGKPILVTVVRAPDSSTRKQSLYIGSTEIASATDTPRDSSCTDDKLIGTNSNATLYHLASGTGLRFFGYARRAITEVELRQMTRFMRGLL